MRRELFPAALLVISALACERGAPAGEVVAVVDGEPFTREALVESLRARRGDELRVELVEDRLVERAAISAGVTVEPAEVEAAVDAEIRATRFGADAESWRADLERRGLDPTRWRARRVAEKRVELLARALMARDVAPAAVEALFDRRYGAGGARPRVRHLLVSTDPDVTRFYPRAEYEAEREAIVEAARRAARELQERLLGGADFAALARERSDDAASAPRGGDLGASFGGRFGPAFDDAVARLSPGDPPALVETAHGYHVVRVEGVRLGVRYAGRHLAISSAPTSAQDARSDEARLAEARDEAQRLRAEIVAGRDFGELARTHSDDAATRELGGDLGNFGPGRLGPGVDAVLETLAPGRVSEPVRTPAGFELVELRSRELLPGEDQKLVRHLLVATDYDRQKRRRLEGRLPAMAEARAREILARLERSPDELGAVARELSEDELTRRHGGEYPAWRPGALGPEVDAALAAMKPGELRVVRSARGFHVLQLVEVRRVALAEVREELEAELRARPVSAGEVARFREGLRKAAKVEWRAPP